MEQPQGRADSSEFDVNRLTTEEQELHRRANRVAKVSMQDIKMLHPDQVRQGRENKDLCIRLKKTRKLIANTTVDLNPSWTIQWITFIGGWWKFSRKVKPARSANIPTPLQLVITKNSQEFLTSRRYLARKFCAVVVAALLSLTILSGASAQTKHKKAKKPKSAPCRAGCKPDTSVPDVGTSSADDATSQKLLSELARSLHNAAPGSYEKLSAFAGKHAGDIWGARAALALGYDDYQKTQSAAGLAWFSKATGDTVLSEYVLSGLRNPSAL
jgi:hypothetical protein